MKNGSFTIDGKEYRISSSALTPIIYKHIFGKDILLDMQRLKSEDPEDQLSINETITKLAFVMSKQASLDAPSTMRLSSDDFYIWLNGFDNGDFLDADVIEKITRAWLDETKISSKTKNLTSPKIEN